jgi:hypothetical protein
MSEGLIDELLTAAFRELQHDSGPGDIEYRHQHALLRDKFRKILDRHKVGNRKRQIKPTKEQNFIDFQGG